jgi:hypothetical protein
MLLLLSTAEPLIPLALLDEAHLLDALNHGNAKLGGVNSLLTVARAAMLMVRQEPSDLSGLPG